MPFGNDNQFVVVGPSMGGQISRYALMYMETHSMDHNTRLWISFDSPHLGAVIPLGFQEMLRFFYKNLGDKGAEKSYNENLRSPAARQMLIHQTNPDGPYANAWDYSFAITDAEPVRSAWKTTLSNIGMPQNLRKVALINGKASGGQFQTPGNSMLTVNGGATVWGLDMITARPYFLNTSQSLVFDATYSKAVLNNKTLFGKIWSLVTHQISYYNLTTATNLPYGAIDGCNGGLFDVQKEFATKAIQPLGIFSPLANYVQVYDLTHYVSFIPTPSSLALSNPNFDWRNSLDIEDILCNNKTPFDNIFVPEDNEEHTALSENSANWVIDEIMNGNNSCSKICVNGINGDGNITSGQTKTYTLSNTLPSTATTYWYFDVSHFSNSSSNNTSIQLHCNSNISSSYLYASIISSCSGRRDLRKRIGSSVPKSGTTQHNDEGNFEIVTDPEVVVYPNPANEAWKLQFIHFDEVKDLSASLYDINGNKVWSYNTENLKQELMINNKQLAQGVYILKARFNNQNTVQKLLK